jgi:Holliday junction resolvase
MFDCLVLRAVMPKKPNVKESVIERELVARVKAAGGFCLKVTVLGRRGFPDRLVILPGGKVCLVELKRPRGSRISIHQGEYIKLLMALNVDCFIVKNAEDIARLLSQD